MNKIIISQENIDIRIDKLLSNIYSNLTRTEIEKYIKEGCLLKNNEVFKKNSYKTKINDEFIFNIPIKEKNELKPTKIPLNIVYEDNDLIVINKQANLTTHPGAGNNDFTLVNALLDKYGNKNLSNISGEFRLGIIHRLDKDTTGLMIVAKNNDSHIKLAEQLQKRILKRKYIALLWGVLKPLNGKIEGYIERDKQNKLKMIISKENIGRYSLTNYETIETFLSNSISFVEFNLDTGRTHQIRVHCNYMNCPLIGDKLYGGKNRYLKKDISKSLKENIENFSRQALHSYKIEFIHPTTNKKLEFSIDLPDDMKNIIQQLKQN